VSVAGGGQDLVAARRGNVHPVAMGGATLEDRRSVAAAQRQVHRLLNASPHVAQLAALGRGLNARIAGPAIVQRVGDDANMAPQPQQPQQLPAPVAAQQGHQGQQQAPAPQQQAQAPAPEFSMANLLFASRAPDAQHDGERSLYFRGGRRLRLMHDSGPSVGRHTMARYTFRRDAQANRDFDEGDYRAAMQIADAAQRRNRLDAILAPVAEGGRGRLFEIEQGGYGDPNASTHVSRGSVAPHGIDGEPRLQRLLQIAQDARQELPPLKEAESDTRHARRSADRRYDRAHDEVRSLERRLRRYEEALEDLRNLPFHQRTDQHQDDVDSARRLVRRAEAKLDRALRKRRTARDRFRNAQRAERDAQRAYRARLDYYNGLVRAEF
jgi:hypothetical protein